LVSASGAPVVLSGERFGVDFNPAALRIVSDTGENLRAFPSDTAPTGVSRITGQTIVDGALNENGAPATGIVGAAYTNNDKRCCQRLRLHRHDHPDRQAAELVAHDRPRVGRHRDGVGVLRRAGPRHRRRRTWRLNLRAVCTFRHVV
jgi:hypothetical protein